MPLIVRIPVDHSIRDFRAAAGLRYREAQRSAVMGDRLVAIYLCGYAAEMLLKAAYFRLLGWTPTQVISLADLNIWDRWKELDDEQRAAVIVDAYTQAEGPEAANEITLADGVTPHEALALGLLPFKVVPAPKQNDSLPLEAYRTAQAKETRHTLLGSKGKELRYARIQDAQQAQQRLQQGLPGSSWVVVQELATES